jgi:hypothetical protein
MIPIKAQIIANSTATLVARVQDTLGNNLLQSTTTSIVVNVFDLIAETQTYTGSQTIASVVFNTLQVDGRWSQDNTGYNVAIPLAGSCFPAGGTTYRAEVNITPTNGDAFIIIYDLQCIEVLG